MDMDSDNLLLAGTVTILTLALIISVSVITISTDQKIVALTKAGASPLEASCAVSKDIQICTAAAALRR